MVVNCQSDTYSCCEEKAYGRERVHRIFGLCYEIRPDEIETLEERSDPRQIAAKRVGLTSY